MVQEEKEMKRQNASSSSPPPQSSIQTTTPSTSTPAPPTSSPPDTSPLTTSTPQTTPPTTTPIQLTTSTSSETTHTSTSPPSSPNVSTGTSPTLTSSSSVSVATTIETSLVIGSNANGAFTQTIVTTNVITPSVTPGSSNSSTSSSSHTGAIAGGVVGGVAAVAIIAFLLWYCLRKRKREEFDGDFDPDRVISSPGRGATLPRMDLDATPYSYNPHDGPDMHAQQQPDHDMAQRSDGATGSLPMGAAVPPSQYSHSQYSDPQGNQTSTSGSQYPPTSHGHGPVTMPSGDYAGVSPGPSLNTIGTIPSAKEREAATDRRRLHLSNEDYSGNVGSGSVIQHQDGGRVRLDRTPEEPQREIPPSYDSISPDDEPRH